MNAQAVRVLIVDDSPADRLVYQIALKATGALEVVEAADGKAGLEACKKQLPDCIVLDFNMPDIDGLRFMALLKEQHSGLPCAVVMLTGVRDELVAVRAMKAGITDYLPKTVNTGEILEHTVLGAIEKFQMRREIENQRLALETSEREYRTLMEALPQPVWRTDPSGDIRFGNRRWLEYTGLVPADSPRLTDVIFPEDRDRFGTRWDEAVRADRSFEIELRLRRASDGANRQHLIRFIPIQGGPCGTTWLGAGMDIEDRQQALLLIQQKQKWDSIGLLAGGIAHDFNNLLVGIVGGASLLSESLPATAAAQSTLRTMIESGERAAYLTRQLLAYSGKGQYFVERLQLPAIVRKTSDLIKDSIPDSVRVSIESAEPLPLIEADASQIQQIVMNLVVNAVEAIPEGQPGTVVVRTFAADFSTESLPGDPLTSNEHPTRTYVVLEVKDTGWGMDVQTSAKIFDPFFTTKFMGRGLGLAAVQGIVRLAKGRIAVESAPGKGSTFRVFLPAALGAEPVPIRRSVETVPSQRPGGTILVIDDERGVRQMTSLALDRAGYKVLAAEDGATGLRLLEKHHASISLVLLDMSMPGMNGKEVLTRMRSAGYQVPVAICSGYSEPDVLNQFAGCDFTAFIQKPFKLRELAQRVNELLRAGPL